MAEEINDPPLPETPRREKPESSFGQFRPAVLWLGERQIISFCVFIAIISPILSLWYLSSALKNARATTWTVQTDAAGAFTIAPATFLDPDAQVFREICIQAADLSFKRNPSGLSYLEFIDRMFVDAARAKLVGHVSAQADRRKRLNLVDSPEIQVIERVDKSTLDFSYRVKGIIVRSGIIEGNASRDVGRFSLLLRLAPQPGLQNRARYPFVVVDWGVRIEWEKQGREEWSDSQRLIP